MRGAAPSRRVRRVHVRLNVVMGTTQGQLQAAPLCSTAPVAPKSAAARLAALEAEIDALNHEVEWLRRGPPAVLTPLKFSPSLSARRASSHSCGYWLGSACM